MAVPAQPTVTGLCTIGLERGGQFNPSSAQISLATDDFLQEIKADIMRVAANNPLLVATATAVTVRGQQRYSIPDDHNRSLNLNLLNGPDEWRGTAQTGTSTTLTLASDNTETDDTYAGKWLILTGGTGVGQYRQITAYNSTTKVATVDTSWTTTPDNTSTYLVGNRETTLWPHNFDDMPSRFPNTQNVGWPQRASLWNQEFYLYPTPDMTYGLIHHYFVDISKLDEAGTLFLQLLREWRSLWVQGITAYTMQRYDDARFPAAWALYQDQLKGLTTDSIQYSRCEIMR